MFAIYFVFSSGEKKVGTVGCKTSVKSMVEAIKMKKPFKDEINCPTIKVEMTGSNEKNIKYQLAEKGRECLEQFMVNGKVPNLFKNEGLYCVICHDIEFMEKRTLNDFQLFFFENEILAPGYSGMTYSQLFFSSKNANTENKELLKNKNLQTFLNKDIITDKNMAIIFLYGKGRSGIEKWGKSLFDNLYNFITFQPRYFYNIITGKKIYFDAKTEVNDYRAMMIYRQYENKDELNLNCDYFPSK